MKTRSILLAIVMLSVLTIAKGQGKETFVKILPTATKGIIKVHYAHEVNEPITVVFKTDSGFKQADRITGTFATGVSKKYDVRKIKDNDFWVEISSPTMTVTYKVSPANNKHLFVASLERTVYNHSLVASNN